MLEIFTSVSQEELNKRAESIAGLVREKDWMEKQLDLLSKRKDLRDHSARVCQILSDLAKHERLNDKNTLLLKCAGLLHDIGKLSIPLEIFEKDVISDEEMQLIRTHVRVGFNVVRPYLPREALIIVGHHEFQKDAYPRKFCRGDKPKLRRKQLLLAIADSTDAALSERSYKKAWPIEAARESLVDAFDEKELVEVAIATRIAISTK